MIKKIWLLALSLATLSANAQFLTTYHEYYFKLKNGKALSFFSPDETKPTGKKATNGLSKFDNAKSIIQASTVLQNQKSDSLTFDNFNVADTKQVWIVELSTPTSRIQGGSGNLDFTKGLDPREVYFTIKNKKSGKYLTKTSKIFQRAGTEELVLAPLLGNGTDANQHWRIQSVEESPIGGAKLFVGRNSVFGVFARWSNADGGTSYMADRSSYSDLPNVGLTPRYNLLPKDYALNIEPATSGKKIILSDFRRVCPKNLIRGDREFATGTQRDIFNRVTELNHKMGITVSVELSLVNNNTEVWAKVTMVAEEQGGDGTKADGIWNQKVYQAPAGKSIRDFVSLKAAYSYFESSMNRNSFYADSKYTSEIIDYYELVGDTMGDDVSTDDDCNDDTRIDKIKFNPIWVYFND